MNCGRPSGWCEALYLAKATDLILYGRALGLSHSESEDVLHETFLALMRRPDRPAQLDHYCVRTFRNRAINYRRSLWRRLAREWESLNWFEATEDSTEAENAAMKALEQLPQPQREVVVLKIWHGYTFDEIGELLEISPNTVAGRYRYGLQKIRTVLVGATYERVRDDQIGDAVAVVGTTPPVREN